MHGAWHTHDKWKYISGDYALARAWLGAGGGDRQGTNIIFTV